MGGSDSKQSSNESYKFTIEEKSKLNITFKSLIELSSPPQKTSFTSHALKEFLANKLNDHAVDQLYSSMKTQSKHQGKEDNVDEDGFSLILSWILKGTISDHINMFCNTETNDKDKLIKIIEEYISSFVDIMKKQDQIPSSISDLKDDSIRLFAQYLLYDLFYSGISLKNVEGADPPKQKFTESEFESWLTKCPLVSTVISKVIAHHFHISSDSENDENCIKIPNLIFPRGPVKSGLLDIPAIVMINSNLPSELQNEWTLLFSTMKDGESFSSFVQHIVQEGPTALLVRDKDGHTFGGFASSSWELNASFTGKDNCFLFNTFPRFGIYGTTGYNDHYMYINQHQQTLPNGLGMGGQFDYFGLWIDSNFGSGKCSSSCTTFENPMLSSMENFKFDAIEVWRVGPKPKKDEDEEGDHGSILDKDPLAKAMLMLIDKGTLSEGLREADPTADSPEDKILPPL